MYIQKKLRNIFLSLVFATTSLNCSNLIEEPPVNLPNLEKRINEKNIKNKNGEKYAVIFSGYNEERFKQDIFEMNSFLMAKGFKEKNIFILDEADPLGVKYPVLDTIEPENVSKLFNYLSQNLDEKDKLFIYFTGHGDWAHLYTQNKKVSMLTSKKRGLLTSICLEDFLDKIKTKKIILFTDLCHAGEFATRFHKQGYVAISSSSLEGKAFSTIEDSFSRKFIEAYKNVKKADTDQNGKISIKEAFEYAIENHSFSNCSEAILKSIKDPNDIYF